MSSSLTPYALNAAFNISSCVGISPAIARSPRGVSFSRARFQSSGIGRSDTVQPMYLRYPPRAGSATVLSHEATSGPLSNVASAWASSRVGQLAT